MTTEPRKRPYKAPTLVVYGSLEELTKAGTGVADEDGQTKDPTRKI